MEYHHPNTVSADAFEKRSTVDRKVACDGGKGPLGHPRVYLRIEQGEDRIVCPYCSRCFIYNGAH